MFKNLFSSFPFYTQHNSNDCGPSCLKMITAYYKKSIAMSAIRDKSYVGIYGSSLRSLSEVAQELGFRTSVAKMTWRQLQEEAPTPFIAHWNNDHFVVVYKIRKNKTQAGYTDYSNDAGKKLGDTTGLFLHTTGVVSANVRNSG